MPNWSPSRLASMSASGRRNFQKFRTGAFEESAWNLCGVPEVRGPSRVWPAQIVANRARPVRPGQAAGSPRQEGHAWAPEPCGLGATEALLLRGEGKAATGRPGFPALVLFRALLPGRMRAVWGWEGAFAQRWALVAASWNLTRAGRSQRRCGQAILPLHARSVPRVKTASRPASAPTLPTPRLPPSSQSPKSRCFDELSSKAPMRSF